MKKYMLIFILFVATIFQSLAQNRVELCESFNESGVGSGVFDVWNIKPDGGFVYILYNQNSRLTDGTWYLYLDYDWDKNGQFGAYETILLTPDLSKSWASHDYKFTEGGKYIASIVYNGEVLAKTAFEIIEISESSSTDITTDYYENSSIQFCNSVNDAGIAQGISSTFYLSGTAGKVVTVLVNNNSTPIKSNVVFIDVYNAVSFEMVETYSIEVTEDWDWFKFEQTFKNPGKYLIELYNANDVYINTSEELTIN